MSKTVEINSDAQLQDLIKQSKVVVTDFYADWCGPCKAIAPAYEKHSDTLSRPGKVTFTRVNVDRQKEAAARYSVSSLPTFIVFKNGNVVERIRGADPVGLQSAVKKLAAEVDAPDGASGSGGFGESSSSSRWVGRELPRGYKDVTEEIDVRGLDLLNSDPTFATARGLFDSSKPSALDVGKGKGKTDAEGGAKDWVESDTDEQLMLYMPFQSTLKVHTLHITSCPPSADEEDAPMRPKTLQLFSNRAHVLGFDEAESISATQDITLRPEDWDPQTQTAKVELRFVKFQSVTSLVLFVVDGEGSSEKVRIDRIRVIGESGEKRDMGKLEKMGEGAE